MNFDSTNHTGIMKRSQLSDLLRYSESTGIKNRISLMEDVNRGNFFPPLAIPDAYKRRRIGTALSKEGQTVKKELESKQHTSHLLKQNLTKESESNGKVLTSNDIKAEEFCLTCNQRLSLQFSARATSREQKDNRTVPKEKIRGCICILCNKALPLSPKVVGRHKIVIKSKNAPRKEASHANVLMRGGKGDVNREFQITSIDYDSRLEDMQHRLEIEQSMPSKEVMRRSERKCQLWLLRNEQHIRARTSPKYRYL